MSNEHDGGPAFPIPGQVHRYEEGTFSDPAHAGLSMRDYFAAAALQGIIACVRDHTGAETVEKRCAKAFQYADAMLAERSKEVQG